jgi:hypothetical protein
MPRLKGFLWDTERDQIRKVQSSACGTERDAGTRGRGNAVSVATDGASNVRTMNAGAAPAGLQLGTSGTEAGIGLPADILQQGALTSVACMLTEDEGALIAIVGQPVTRLCCADILVLHEDQAIAGKASSMITSPTATSLERRVIKLIR